MTDTNFRRPDPTAGELTRWYPSFTPAAAALADTSPVERPTEPTPVLPVDPAPPVAAPAPAPSVAGGTRHRISPRAVAGLGSAAATAAVAAGLGVWALGGGQDSSPTAAAVTAQPTTAPLSSAAPRRWCDPAAAVDGVIIGNGPGGTDSGPAAILAFDFAYYVQRSGEAARAVVAPDAVGVEPANLLQSAIDTYIPAGAEHCVTIRAAEPQRFLVTLRERQPSGEEVAYTQQAITTRVVDGRHVITSIGEAS
ncbi:hypothetical protein I1A62_00505 (plasmid) [Rhodococcus sp. USK10]|uniref:hypothetical protein n=1 Tax=Rhodococcus sp. USK10 TaxID=2789739 RepID=UPI001C60725C|nr:hypothetical protein [Rhodococcus sp. USK10]QYA99643.1 hypothetical protein I1A62_00505 [Rhodococcus sp. USK10]